MINICIFQLYSNAQLNSDELNSRWVTCVYIYLSHSLYQPVQINDLSCLGYVVQFLQKCVYCFIYKRHHLKQKDTKDCLFQGSFSFELFKFHKFSSTFSSFPRYDLRFRCRLKTFSNISHCQQQYLFRTTFTRTIMLNLLMKWLLGSNLSQLMFTIQLLIFFYFFLL